MSLFVLDTDIFTLLRHGHPKVIERSKSCRADELAITIITAEEQISGWYALIRQARKASDLAAGYARLARTIEVLGAWHLLPFTEPAIRRVEVLKRQKLKVRIMDLRIAAIVLEHNATLVTRNVKDFQRVPGLKIENWAE
jgi:tRNA(fMet)-specific endonuclease VapC